MSAAAVEILLAGVRYIGIGGVLMLLTMLADGLSR